MVGVVEYDEAIAALHIQKACLIEHFKNFILNVRLCQTIGLNKELGADTRRTIQRFIIMPEKKKENLNKQVKGVSHITVYIKGYQKARR